MSVSRDQELSLIEHLDELRRRITVAAIGVGITTAISFAFATQLIKILLIPASCRFIPAFVCDPNGPKRLLALSPTENFTTYLHVSLVAGIAFAMPILLYELFAYIDPALLPGERRLLYTTAPFVLALFVGGMAFCYFLLLPNALTFLVNFGGEVIENQLRASEYLAFVTTFILGVGIVFEMPAIIVALIRIGLVRREWLTSRRRYMFLGAFVVGALLTPTPDPFNQTLVSLPMYLLFELGLLISRFVGGPRRAA